jgi:N-acetylmuramoyl-L-alanine amidase
MLPTVHSPVPASRRLVGLLAVVVSVALVVVDTGNAPAQTAAAGPEETSGAVAVGAPASRADGVGGGGPGADGSVPDPEDGTTALAPGGTHVVQPGETLGAIAERYGVPSRAMERANRHRRAEALRPGDRLVVPDPDAPRPYTPQEAMAADLEVERMLAETAERYGWNPATVKAVAWYESRWNQHLVSSEGAIGVMQVQPDTGDLMAGQVGRPLDLHDLHDNIEAGVAYLDHLHGVYRGDLRALIAAYHQGPQAVSDRGIYRGSHVYADEVLRLREVFRR